jgi:Right handed beta helix region
MRKAPISLPKVTDCERAIYNQARMFKIKGDLLRYIIAHCLCTLAAWMPVCVFATSPAMPPVVAVSPGGSLEAALAQIRRLRHDGELPPDEPARIILTGGIYPLNRPLRLEARDSGTEAAPLIIEAASGEQPVLSGGTPVCGWTKAAVNVPGLSDAAEGNVWSAEAPKRRGRVLSIRELWVNGRRAIRAREPNAENMERLAGWDKTNETAMIPAAVLQGVENAEGLEMVVDQVWEIAVLRVKSFVVEGTNAVLTFKQPESKIEFDHPWPPVIVNRNYRAPFFLQNAPAFLDSPGEWFEDLRAGRIYYWPRDGEDMAHAEAIAPAIETVVKIEGSLGRPVSNVQFQGISFAYTTWMRPSEKGHVPLQAGMFLLKARRLAPRGAPYHPGLDNVAWIGRPPGAVSVKNADHISFDHCLFEHTGSAGLDLKTGTGNDLVKSCIFRDIGGNGIQLGEFSEPGVETHLPWNPPDAREICSNEIIADNVLTECGREDWGCAGIAAGYVRHTKIEHNDVFNLPYTGISVGWGWTKMTNVMRNNSIFANRIHNIGQRLADLGGIYTLSAQPGTVIAENSISNIEPSPYAPDSGHWFYLYLDEGSSFITVRDNWCPGEKFLRNANGPGNIWINNGPEVSRRIEKAAGIEREIKNLNPSSP